MSSNQNLNDISFLRWALPRMGYRWQGFRKPRRQIIKRIRERMKQIGVVRLDDYQKYLQENSEEWAVLDRLCDVTISKFFRDRKMWDYLESEILPEIIRNRYPEPLKVWSAGCCNGEEPYTIAMIISKISGEDYKPCIIGSDRNRQVLERAEKGLYPSGVLKEMPDEEIDKYFQPARVNDVEEYRIKKCIREKVKFEQRDIRDQPPEKTFDLLFCRNLGFTYFAIGKQKEFLEKIKPHLGRNGFLIIGANEKLPENDWLTLKNKTHRIFRKR